MTGMKNKVFNCSANREIVEMEWIRMEKQQYICDKCGNEHYVSDQFQATGGNFAKIFDVQNKKFITVSCTRCGFSELYRGQTSDGWNVLDFLMGG